MNDFNELEINARSRPIAVLCLGRVTAFYSRPMLEERSWARRCDLRSVVTDYL